MKKRGIKLKISEKNCQKLMMWAEKKMKKVVMIKLRVFNKKKKKRKNKKNNTYFIFLKETLKLERQPWKPVTKPVGTL